MTARLLGLAVAVAVVGCGPDGADGPAEAPTAAAATPMEDAFAACTTGDLEAGIASLDAWVRQTDGAPDPLVLRGLCHWTRWDRTGDPGDAERAYRDLSGAIAAVEGGAPAATALDRVYSYRAFVAHALDGGWARTAEDLDRAAELAPGNVTHALDHGVARSQAGDTARARRELGRFLALTHDSTESQRRDLAETLLSDLEGGAD